MLCVETTTFWGTTKLSGPIQLEEREFDWWLLTKWGTTISNTFDFGFEYESKFNHGRVKMLLHIFYIKKLIKQKCWKEE